MKLQSMLTAALAFVVLAGCGAKPAPEPSPAAESPEPEVTADTADKEVDFSLFAGIWHTENNMRELTIYDSGGFGLKDGTVHFDGYLVESMEFSGKFELYLENNTRWGENALLFADSSHPGTLTLQEGLGAELFVPGERVIEEEDVPPFVLILLDEVPDVGRVYHLERGDTPTIFTVRATERLNNFRILALDYLGPDSKGNPAFVTTELFYQEEMIPNEEITFAADVYGALPNIGISYDDKDGNGNQWYLTISGIDGSLEITRFVC